MATKTATRPKAKKIAERAKQWRNRYETTEPFVYDDGALQTVGQYWGRKAWPSKDVAESVATDWIGECPAGRHVKHLGAFPVTE